MLATPYALLGAVFTLLLYLALTEQLDYASVRRRQLDAWAAIFACVWLFGIAYGGASAVQERASAPPIHASDLAVPAIPRVHQPDLSLPAAPESEASGEDDLGLAPASIPPALSVSTDGDGPSAASDAESKRGASAEDRRLDDREEAASSEPAEVLAEDLPVLPPEAAPVSEIIALPPSVPIEAPPTAVPVVIVLPSAPPPPTATPRPPVAEPRAPLQPTPHCGNPNDIEVQLSILDAYAQRDADRHVVRYEVAIANKSGFPVEITNVVVTAQDAKSGNDQFGNERRSDMRIDALRDFTLDGGVVLEKHPSPFGRSELCVSFVTQTCGQRSRFPNTRRCENIRGY